jgi:hypothetical protein
MEAVCCAANDVDALLSKAKTVSDLLIVHATGLRDIGRALNALEGCHPTVIKLAAIIALHELESESDFITYRKFANAVLSGSLQDPDIGWCQFCV